ncbi:Purple acid phosphatase 18 [Platanthera zijinensis]|uniref:Purple acid phosphatase n=1 Tax=Platanthera zijinensis TaxID=2320716 RepID=A0AAP0G7J2_9ASPA
MRTGIVTQSGYIWTRLELIIFVDNYRVVIWMQEIGLVDYLGFVGTTKVARIAEVSAGTGETGLGLIGILLLGKAREGKNQPTVKFRVKESGGEMITGGLDRSGRLDKSLWVQLLPRIGMIGAVQETKVEEGRTKAGRWLYKPTMTRCVAVGLTIDSNPMEVGVGTCRNPHGKAHRTQRDHWIVAARRGKTAISGWGIKGGVWVASLGSHFFGWEELHEDFWVTVDKSLPSVVEYGTSPGQYTGSSEGENLSYRYLFYTSGKIHHVVIGPLKDNTVYYYRCGGQEPEFQLKTPPSNFPIKFAVVGDLGQTDWTATTLSHIDECHYDLHLLPGDLSYADYQQHLWDSFGDLLQPYASTRPWMVTEGNHEKESIPFMKSPFQSYNARWKMPYEESGSTSNLYYSFEVAGVHVIMLGSYTDYGEDSEQYAWLKRKAVPFLRTEGQNTNARRFNPSCS